jgi:glycerophosphoryl diester phosphodiesterase
MQVIAHRGASAFAPENTLSAFKRALEMGAKAIEFDVHQTSDGELVVIHDPILKRLAGKSWRIKDIPWQKLSTVDVGRWFSADFAGEKVPRLEEVFDLVGDRAELHIEIKSGSSVYPGIEQRVVEAVNRRGLAGQSVLSSFDHRALHRLRALDKKLSLGYLLGWKAMLDAFKEMALLDCETFNISVSQATKIKVRESHSRGFRVLVYTVTTPQQVSKLKVLGVDGIFANDPAILSQ